MSRLSVSDIKPGENNSAIVNFGVDRSLVLVPHLIWHSRQRRWNELPWHHPQSCEVKGLETVKLIVGGSLAVEVACRPTPRVTHLAANFQQRQLAFAWQAALDYLERFAGGYPQGQLADTIAAGPELLPLLRRGRVPVDPGARTQVPNRSVMRLFPGRIGGMFPQ